MALASVFQRFLVKNSSSAEWRSFVDAAEQPIVQEVLLKIGEISAYRQPNSSLPTTEEARALLDRSPEPSFTISASDTDRCYYVHALMPITVDFTTSRQGHLCAIAPTLISAHDIHTGVDLNTMQTYLTMVIRKSANPMSFKSSMVILQELQQGPALRLPATPAAASGLKNGFQVRRTQEGTVVTPLQMTDLSTKSQKRDASWLHSFGDSTTAAAAAAAAEDNERETKKARKE